MARRTFTVVDVVEIYVHWHAGRSKNQLAASLGLDRKTIRKYLAPAEEAGIIPGGPPMSEEEWAKLLKVWFPELASRWLNQVTWAEIEPHREYVKGLLETTTVSTIHQRLREEGKLTVSLSTFRRWVTENLPDESARSRVTVLRDDVEPGSEAQVDYGFLGQWINPATGKRHRIWAFVMVLPSSRHMFVRPVVHIDQHAWTQAHVEAFRFFGGVPRRLVPDNLRTAVDRPDLYELVSERQGRSLITTSNRAPSDWYPLFPNPVVAESLLDRLVNTSHQVIMNGPSYRPNKRPRNPIDKNDKPSAS
ncbi:ATP-binding protein [Streptomyces sp. NPDC058872]|uniref:ATP-binding protein n=1 Tax=Streptomyces sp. NPDC058872 TaxID=3346661 RepID=UPI0036B1140F